MNISTLTAAAKRLIGERVPDEACEVIQDSQQSINDHDKATRKALAKELGEACRAVLDTVEFEKASPSDPLWRQLHRIADKAEPALRRKILEAIAQTVQNVDEAALERALGRADTAGALKAINWGGNGDPQLRAAYQTILREVYEASRETSATQLARDLDVPATFNLAHPRAEAWAETVAAARVVQVSDETVDALRAMVTRGFREAIHPRDLARMIRGVKDAKTGQYKNSLIGLTERQSQAVWNYRTALENDDIERSQDVEDRMVERYRDKLVLQRAENISRTETIRAANEGTQEAWRQAKEEGWLRGNEQREWITTPDDRSCHSCLSMDGQKVDLDEEFQDEEGEFDPVMVPPLHPACRCSVGIVAPKSDGQDEEQ